MYMNVKIHHDPVDWIYTWIQILCPFFSLFWTKSDKMTNELINDLKWSDAIS